MHFKRVSTEQDFGRFLLIELQRVFEIEGKTVILNSEQVYRSGMQIVQLYSAVLFLGLAPPARTG